MALYETEEGQPITSQSMIKAFRMCPMEAMFKYHLRLKPKVASTPLTRGKWVHSIMEDHYNGVDWRPTHKKLSSQFSKLFDEEKEKLGNLPEEIDLLMASYFWHYGDPSVAGTEWEVHEVERLIEAEMPNGHLFRGKVDMIVEDEFGLWLVDHKTHGRFPDWSYRLLDEQSTLYTWAARENDIPVQGFIWNYVSTAGFPKYQVLKNGKTFYKKSFDAPTTYPAFARAIKRAKAEHPDTFLKDKTDLAEYKERLSWLKRQRWQGPEAPQTSEFFRRDVLSKDDELIQRVLKSSTRTSERMHSYDFTDPDSVERDVNACKGFFCSYKDLSMGQLVNGDFEMIAKRNYREHDPMGHQTEDSHELKG